jgi:hypothetical protein
MAFVERRKSDPKQPWTGPERRIKGEANRDPITGAPGAHPVGTGFGAAAGGVAGAAIAGPVGAAVGAVVGGLAGKGIAERIDPTAEEAYWRTQYTREPYYERGYTYADYHPGYRTGWEARARYAGRSFEDIERELEGEYSRRRGASRLGWDKNRHAARAAWERFDPDTEPLEGSH